MLEQIVILDAHTSNPGELSWTDFGSLRELKVYEHSTQAARLTMWLANRRFDSNR